MATFPMLPKKTVLSLFHNTYRFVFQRDQNETTGIHHPQSWFGLKQTFAVLVELILRRGVAVVFNLDGLVHGVTQMARGKTDQIVDRTAFHGGNELFTVGTKGVAKNTAGQTPRWYQRVFVDQSKISVGFEIHKSFHFLVVVKIVLAGSKHHSKSIGLAGGNVGTVGNDFEIQFVVVVVAQWNAPHARDFPVRVVSQRDSFLFRRAVPGNQSNRKKVSSDHT